jgi:signal peptidase I
MSEPAAHQSQSDSSSKKPLDSETNIKETVEAILVAFILAFMFRSFVVEAFVIPTGSMAPTLAGAHIHFRCDDCGYQWDVNYPSRTDLSDDTVIPSRTNELFPVDPETNTQPDKVLPAWCPNCGYPVTDSLAEASDPDNTTRNTPVRYGDRILVLKYLYLFQQPRRWDVVVFKTPDAPERWDYNQNYIKRLIGKPGETVMILDGDIYVASSNKPPDQLTAEDFAVQTKPRDVQDALWRVVYDNDYRPQNKAPARARGDVRPFEQPWRQDAGAGWDTSAAPGSDGGRIFAFDNQGGAGTLHFVPDEHQPQQPLTDWLGYDATSLEIAGPGAPIGHHAGGYLAENSVSDLRLAFTYQRLAGDGPLRIELTKLDRTFIAELAPRAVSLYERGRDGQEALLRTVALDGASAQARGARVEFMNVDYRLTLRIDGRDVITTTPAEYHPDVAALLKSFKDFDKPPPGEARIVTASQACRVAHLSLWRDVYYMNRAGGPILWGSPDDWPNRLMRLGPDEYFVCGDNSLISGDGRYWNKRIDLPWEDLEVQAGRVPGRFMLGKAFFVYWPAGYRPIPSAPALAPNFGDMRFIH